MSGGSCSTVFLSLYPFPLPLYISYHIFSVFLSCSFLPSVKKVWSDGDECYICDIQIGIKFHYIAVVSQGKGNPKL